MIVPFLVTPDTLDHPILVTNAITLLIEKLPRHILSSAFKQALPNKSHTVITQLVNLIQAEREPSVSLVKTTKQKITIPANNKVSVKCRIERNYLDQSIPVAFEPISSDTHQDLHVMPSVLRLPKGTSSSIKISIINNFRHDVKIQPKTLLGHVFPTQSVTPLERVQVKEAKLQQLKIKSISTPLSSQHSDVHSNHINHITTHSSIHVLPEIDHEVEAILQQIDITGLSETEKEQARQLFREEIDVFCKGPDDIGNVTDCRMRINLKDHTPVQKTYYSMPKPFYTEVKNYTVDLLNKGWIKKSKSSYVSPIVAVTKKDGSLRLCCDYRELNAKTIPDRHPIPRVQDSLDILFDKKWF